MKPARREGLRDLGSLSARVGIKIFELGSKIKKSIFVLENSLKYKDLYMWIILYLLLQKSKKQACLRLINVAGNIIKYMVCVVGIV